VFDVAYALEYTAPFRGDDECLRWLGYSEPPDRIRRIELFASAYGLPFAAGLVEEVLSVQADTIRAVRELAERGFQPQVDRVADGYLAELSRRIAWTESNRRLLGDD